MTGKIDGIFVELKADVDASGVVSGESKVTESAKKIEKAFKETDIAVASSTKKIVKSSNVAAKSMGRFGRSAGQAGIQFQQFTGQVQGGVNPMIALSQQAADLGIVMGAPLLGVVASLGAGLALFLVPELFNAKKATSELTDKLKELKNEQVLTAEQTKFLALSQAAETKEKKERIKEIDKEIESLTKLLKLQTGQAESSAKGRSAAANRKSANKRIEETNKLLSKNRAELDTLKQETGQLAVISLDVEKKRQEGIKKTSDIMTALQQQVEIANAGLDGGADAARRLAIALELGYENASLLPQAMKESLTELEAVEAKTKEVAEAERAEAKATSKLKSELAIAEAKAKNERGSNLDRMREEIATETELLGVKYANQLLLLEQSLVNEEITKAEFEMLREESAKAHADRLIGITQKRTESEARLEEALHSQKISAVSNTFSALSNLMNTGSRKLFKIGKAAAMSGAIVDGYAAVARTMKETPYPYNIPLAIAQAAASAAQVQGIAKQKFGGGSSNATSFSGGLPAVNTQSAGGQSQQTQNISVSGISPDEFVRAGTIIDTINGAISDGYTINFAGG